MFLLSSDYKLMVGCYILFNLGGLFKAKERDSDICA